MNAPRLLIFDLDGTLVDSVADIAEAVGRSFAELHLPPPGEALVRNWVGEGSRQLLRRAMDWAGVEAPAERADREFERFMRHYGDCLCLRTRLYPGARELLQALPPRGIRAAVCTNKPHRFVERLLRWLEIAELFGGWLGGDALPRRKPHAEPLLWLARQAGATPAESLMVGDSNTDVAAARAAGMPVVVLRHGYPGDTAPDAADGVFDGFEALSAWIEETAPAPRPAAAGSGA